MPAASATPSFYPVYAAMDQLTSKHMSTSAGGCIMPTDRTLPASCSCICAMSSSSSALDDVLTLPAATTAHTLYVSRQQRAALLGTAT